MREPTLGAEKLDEKSGDHKLRLHKLIRPACSEKSARMDILTLSKPMGPLGLEPRTNEL